MKQGDFSTFQYYDNVINGYLEDAWNGFQMLKETKGVDAFAYLSENEINYDDPIWVDIIAALNIEHNHASLSVTMRDMQTIARTGWATYAACQSRKSERIAVDDNFKSMVNSKDFVKNLFKYLQGVNHDDKCPHGYKYYACMACSH
jgi:hypothetical protein